MAPHPSPPSVADKAGLRAGALARRDALDPHARAQAAAEVARIVLAMPEFGAGAGCVGGFWPIRSEIDPRPILDGLRALHRPLALPKVTPGGLIFRAWPLDATLARGAFGLSEPADDQPEVHPAVLVVPLAAFDRAGQRIGYGRGYYDGAIARLSARGPLLTVGIAFAVQEVAHVPAEPHDRPLDRIVTEAGAVALSGA